MMPLSEYQNFYRRAMNLKDPAYKNEFKYNMAGFPGLGWMFRWEGQRDYNRDYMTPRGLTWADMKYPALQYGAGTLGSGIGNTALGSLWVSSNLSRMYGEYKPRPYDYRHDPMYR